MSFTVEQLYSLLPAIDRLRDAEQGAPLKALLAVLAEQIAVLEEDLAQLYDDQFIETCADWVVPYIGDLLGVRMLHQVSVSTYSPRAYVANTLACRRRKGTAVMLAQLAQDVTGWHAQVVEFFERLATTQYLNHRRPDPPATVDLRRWRPLERLDTAFDELAHTVDVHCIASGHGCYNLPNVGIFLWRLNSYPLTSSPAVKVDNQGYLFSPLGNNTPLFTWPTPEDELADPEAPVVPMPISRRAFHEYPDAYYGRNKSLFLEVDGRGIELQSAPQASELIEVCDLSDVDGGWAHTPPQKIAIDPVLGRIAFPADWNPNEVLVTYHYGFSADMGGGEYERADSFDEQLKQKLFKVLKVPAEYPTIRSALLALETALKKPEVAGGIVEISDSGRYTESFTIDVPDGKHLVLRAAIVKDSVDYHRPTLVLAGGDIQINVAPSSQVTLNGLLIAVAGLAVKANGESGRLRLQHCTLVPGRSLSRDGTPQHPDLPSLIVEKATTIDTATTLLTVEIDHSIVGPLRLPAEQVELQVRDSLIDAMANTRLAIAASADGQQPEPGPPATLERATIIGAVYVSELTLASEVIFTGNVTSDRRQVGCVRFSCLPDSAQTPRPYHCQSMPADLVELRRLFTSLRYSDAGYGQLSQYCPNEIRESAEDGGEMGAFHDLYQPQRETNLRAILDEYLRVSLEAGIFYAS